jgi:ribose transport system permease protein
MNSIQSNALEPTRSELKELSGAQKLARLLPVYGLVILTVFLILLFSILLPNTFPTVLNLRSIISDKAIILILSLGVMIPMSAGRIDLTVGYGIVLWHILAISLQTMYGFSWPVAVITVLLLGAFMGMLNGLLVEVAKIDSFIATLGTGTVLYALALWHSGGRQIVGTLPDNFYALNTTMVFGLPITGYYVIAIAFIMWFVYEYLPIGRYLYAIGASPKAAALNGIPVRKYVMGSFIASGLFTALAGVLLAAKLRIGQARPRISLAGTRRRVSWVHHDQARPRQCLGHHDRHCHPGGWHFRHPAIRRLLLGGAHVQRCNPSHRHRHRGLCPAPQGRRTQIVKQQTGGRPC